jgi:hypothetical protein
MTAAVLGAFILGLSPAKADLPSSVEVTDASNTVEIIDFNEFNINASEQIDGANAQFDCVLSHSNTTGQVSASGYFSVTDVSASSDGITGTGDLDGTLTFSAKVLKRGKIVSLSGAKISSTLNGSVDVWVPDYGYATIKIKSAPTFNFKSLYTNLDDLILNATLKAGRLPMSLTALIGNTNIRRSVSVPYPETTLEPLQIPADHVAALSVELVDVVQSTKGAIKGAANRILDNQNPSPDAYSVSGTRSPKTGFSKLTMTGKGALKGTSAVLNIDDSYQLKTGKGFSNVLKAYGYSVAF